MKLLIDLTSLADNFSGIERFAACLAKEMIQDTSDEFTLIFKEAIHPMFSDVSNLKNVKSVVLPRRNKLFFNQVTLPLEIYRHKADWYLFLAFPVPVLLFKRNMVSTIHDMCCWDCPKTMKKMSSLYFKISHLIAMRKCKILITISEFSKKQICNRFKGIENKLRLIYCGVDDKFMNVKSNDDDRIIINSKYNLPDKYLLSLSTLEPRKNLSLLIKSYSHLVLNDEYDIPLVLAGRKGWHMDSFLEGLDTKVLDNIIITGFVDDSDLPIVYKNATAFVFASKYEGFGLPPLEALSCGTRVLSSDAASLPEVLGDCACYFKSDDFDDLCDKLLLLKDYSSLDENIRKFQISKFSWRNEANKLIGFLKNQC